MALVVGSIGVSHFPTPSNPIGPAGRGNPSAGAGPVGVSVWPSAPNAAAGVIGTLTINGQSIVVDLTQQAVINSVLSAINAAFPGLATISRNNRLVLSSTNAITIAGTPALLTTLGLTAGTFN
jgi:hypothetical protein